ncbi:TrkH family potassium uptake protein [Fenollaria massiliensis]|uniref:TrkH family potassium uptake protein n=1 Tax=Fenollaria massiliensis TaxID=938288 RepID=A0A9E7IW51_9FIRM|nr:TrkH family potassium uptake protein [Fenollaria massiliensis]UQK59514.1 TrkH family potassium uptake protein [Fenollaria massiliensis]
MEIRKKLFKDKLNPPQVLALGFLSLILIGSILLNLPIASSSGSSIGYVNSLFTSASAVCVTGLTVLNTARDFTPFGQVIIITLIQFGGLGIMTLATVGYIIMGKKISFKERLMIKEQLNTESIQGIVKLTKKVIGYTFFLEMMGSLLLALRFVPMFGFEKGLAFSIFHAISAYCNAGFDIFGDSLIIFQNDYYVLLILSLLIILGGLGFTVYADLLAKDKLRKLTLHSKVVLIMTGSLLIIGTLSFLLFESSNPGTLGSMNFPSRLANSFFQSVSPRTAGFYSVDMSKIRETTIFSTIMLMFIGGSPGSTAGGIKTTTFACLLLTTISVVKGEEDVNCLNRRLPFETIKRAVSIFLIGLAIVFSTAIILTITDSSLKFINLLFESTSAFGTVGLSAGITDKLSTLGRLVITLTMYIGRVGPLTMAYAFAKRNKKRDFRNAPGNLMVG